MESRIQAGLFCFIVVTILLASCKIENPCEEVKCFNGGICLDGTCICPDGASGTNCEVVLDSCVVISCGRNAIDCENGVCICKDGFYGANCTDSLKLDLAGNYNVMETCLNGSNVTGYSTGLQVVSASIDSMVFTNLRNTSSPIYVLIRNSDSLLITTQTFPDGNSISGGGKFNSTLDTFNLDYILFDALGIPDTCSAQLTR